MSDSAYNKEWYQINKVRINAKNKRWADNNKDKVRANARRYQLKQYGLTTEQYDTMYEGIEGCCEICGDFKETLHVDHDHDTGDVRGLLCGLCNRGIGLLRDDIKIMKAGITYLTKQKDTI